MKKNINAFAKKMLGFSLIELTITIVVIAIVVAAFAPVITKRMKNTSTTVSGLSTKCGKFGADCQLCDKTRCTWCGLSRSLPNNYVIESPCGYASCAAGCTRCTGAGKNCTMCSSGYYLTGGECKSCPAGSYCLGLTKNYITCPAGTYSSAGASSCTKCPVGKYSSAGASSCTNCTAGTYQDAQGQASCISCPMGSYSNTAAATSCTQCPKGQYQNGVGQSVCKTCPTGKYMDMVGRNACVQCPINQSCNATNITGDCGAGQGSYLNNYACQSCPSNCKDCLQPNYCTHCNPGYTLSSGACSGCSAMKYCPGDTKPSYDCPSGSYSTANQEKCSACTAWSAHCLTCNQSKCLTCAPGYTQSGTGCSEINCADGTYLEGTSCLGCPAGYYCTGNVKYPCQVNTIATGSNSSCTPCPSGQVAPATSSSCTACTSKYGSTCKNCNISNCTSCINSSYYITSVSGNPACSLCNSNGTWGSKCITCNTSNCTACESGYTLNSVKKCEKDGCNAGYYLSGSTCLECPAGKYCVGGTTGAQNCDMNSYTPNNAMSSCIQCPFTDLNVYGKPVTKNGAVSIADGKNWAYYMIWMKAKANRTGCRIYCPPGFHFQETEYLGSGVQLTDNNGYTYFYDTGKICRPTHQTNQYSCATNGGHYAKYTNSEVNSTQCPFGGVGCICAGPGADSRELCSNCQCRWINSGGSYTAANNCTWGGANFNHWTSYYNDSGRYRFPP